MRCPHCAGEVPAGSRFCGICGRGITPTVGAHPGEHRPSSPARAAGPPGRSPVDSVSLFELPSSRSGRRVRMALVLVLDAILAGAGVVMLLAYLEARQGGRVNRASAAGAIEPASQVNTPDAVRPAGASPDPAPAPAPEPESTSPPEPQRKPSPARPPEEVKPRAKPARPGTSKPGTRSESSSGAEPADGELAGMAPGWERGPDLALRPAAAVHPPEADVEQLTGALRRVVARHQGELEECHVAASNSAGPDRLLEGRIDIRFTLMPGGRSADVRSVANTTGSAALAECVVAGVRSWSFPATAAAPLELEWPFLFRPAAHAKRQ